MGPKTPKMGPNWPPEVRFDPLGAPCGPTWKVKIFEKIDPRPTSPGAQNPPKSLAGHKAAESARSPFAVLRASARGLPGPRGRTRSTTVENYPKIGLPSRPGPRLGALGAQRGVPRGRRFASFRRDAGGPEIRQAPNDKGKLIKLRRFGQCPNADCGELWRPGPIFWASNFLFSGFRWVRTAPDPGVSRSL